MYDYILCFLFARTTTLKASYIKQTQRVIELKISVFEWKLFATYDVIIVGLLKFSGAVVYFELDNRQG